MHWSSMTAMDRLLNKYLDRRVHYDVLDFGSFINKGQTLNHRQLLADWDVSITGVDIQAGNNVDIQMRKPYEIPVPTASQDVIVANQVFEHIPYPFASMLELARVLRPGGYLFITSPSRGHRHSTYDLWRYYPDSMRAFAKYAELELLEAHTAFPPLNAQRRFLYGEIDWVDEYWGDAVGAFRKPKWKPSLRRELHRRVVLKQANDLGGLDDVPIPRGQEPTTKDRQEQMAALRARLADQPPVSIPTTSPENRAPEVDPDRPGPIMRFRAKAKIRTRAKKLYHSITDRKR